MLKAVWRAVRYHAGTAAFGSILVLTTKVRLLQFDDVRLMLVLDAVPVHVSLVLQVHLPQQQVDFQVRGHG